MPIPLHSEEQVTLAESRPLHRLQVIISEVRGANGLERPGMDDQQNENQETLNGLPAGPAPASLATRFWERWAGAGWGLCTRPGTVKPANWWR